MICIDSDIRETLLIGIGGGWGNRRRAVWLGIMGEEVGVGTGLALAHSEVGTVPLSGA